MKDSRLITLIAISIFFEIFTIVCTAKGEKKVDYNRIPLVELPNHIASHKDTPDMPYTNLEKDWYISGSVRYRLTITKRYYVDNNEPDQGISGAGNSVKDLIDELGMSSEAVLLFSHHPKNGDTTTYTFSTDVTIPSNIILELQKGAMLNIDANVAVTICAPENINALPKQHIKSGKGAMVFIQAGTVYPGWWGTPLDGNTDSTSYWMKINQAIQDDSDIKLLSNANYYINTSGGITLTKKVHIKGYGARFTCGPSVGNNPTITITASESILEHFEVDCSLNHYDMAGDNDFQDADNNFSNNLRRAVKIRGDYIICRYLDTTTAVVGISYEGVIGGEIHHCRLINSKVKSNTSYANNYHAGIRIDDSSGITIHDNYIDGYGQNILIGGSHTIERIRIYTNKLINASNNGIYVSSGTDMEIWDNDVMYFDCTGIKLRDSYHNVHHNRIFCDVPSGAISGITVTGNGYDDGDGFNGRDTIVNANIITGNATAGIMSGTHDGFSLKNPHIINNVINFGPSPSKPAYGIFFKSSSDGSIISGNMAIGGHTFGLLMNADPIHYHDNTLITNNSFIGGTNDAFALVNIRYSLITNNQGKNCASKRSGLMLYNSIYNMAYNNDLGDDQASPTQGYGVEEQGLSDYNEYLNNYVTGVVKAEYYGLGPHSKIIGTVGENDPSNESAYSYSDRYINQEGYTGGSSPATDIGDHPSGPYVDKTNCHPFPGQGIIPDSLRVPIDASIVIRLKADTGIDENTIMLTVNGMKVDPILKQVNGNNRDCWVVYHPTKDFDFEQIVNVMIDAASSYESYMNTYEYSFKVESQAEYNIAQKNTPSFVMDASDQSRHIIIADLGTEIEGAKIIHDSFEPVTPRFGPVNELQPPGEINTVGSPVSLEPPTVFNNPVTVFVPCPGINDLSILKIYFYNPATGWMPASEVDGWMIDDSRVNHPETTPPTIEIKINYFGIFQAGIPTNSKELSKREKNDVVDGEESEIGAIAGTGGCFINILP
jgi:hypothetical protein